MKKFSLLLLTLLVSIHLQARKIKAEGYTISDENDTTKVTFEIPVENESDPKFEFMQKEVKCYDAKGNKSTLKPSTVKAIVFFLNNKTYKMLTCSDNLGVIAPVFSKQQEFFLQVIADDKIKILKVHRTNALAEFKSEEGSYLDVDGYVYKKGNNELFTSGKCDIARVFSDCPEIMNKINDGTYKKEYINPIVLDYNKTCGK
ncbi:MAG: hypothetical protein K0S32_3264 [Bacteroidetes bacterium]|jgi:hypothetical protein|nr:hypothetical protein [Bacteroidota bacterium]